MPRTILLLSWADNSDSKTVSIKTTEICAEVANALMIYGVTGVTPIYDDLTTQILEDANLHDLGTINSK